MQSKTPLLMVTALVCGLGAAFGTWKLVSGAKDAPSEIEEVQVLVPVADVAPYHLFQDTQRFTLAKWPKSRLREDIKDTITDFNQIKGKTSRHYKLRPNEPMYVNDICDNLENDVNERLLNGEVAHAVPVTAERSGGGFVKVGDRVDIAATVQPGNGETAIRTLYLLEDIEVLAVDNSAQKDATPMATPPTRFLLRLTRPQSLVLKYFQDTSKIDFDRRKSGDKTRIGETFYYTAGRKTSTVQQYQEDLPEATVTQNIEAIKLPDPVDDSKPKADKGASVVLSEDDETRIRLLKHKVNINDSGTTRVQDTNESVKITEKVKKEDPKKVDPQKVAEEKKPSGQ